MNVRISDINEPDIAQMFVLHTALTCLRAHFPQAHSFLPAPWQRLTDPAEPDGDVPRMECRPEAPQTLPMLDELLACQELANDATQSLVDLLITCRHGLRWQQSYSAKQGFDRAYLDHYGWINLVSPEGPFFDDSLRLTIGYWGAGLHYPKHSHEPEEIYCILAGQAEFHSDGLPPRLVGPGDWVHHHSFQPHAIDMSPGPLLALVPWRGQNLSAIASFSVN